MCMASLPVAVYGFMEACFCTVGSFILNFFCALCTNKEETGFPCLMFETTEKFHYVGFESLASITVRCDR